MGCVGYNLRARMALAVLVGHAIIKAFIRWDEKAGLRGMH
jgi:hypothetical protein